MSTVAKRDELDAVQEPADLLSLPDKNRVLDAPAQAAYVKMLDSYPAAVQPVADRYAQKAMLQ